MSPRARAAFERIATGLPPRTTRTILRALETRGLIEEIAPGQWEVPIATHTQWCQWCAEQPPGD